MELIQVLIVLILLVYSVYYYFTRTFNYWKDRNVVGPTPVALFGNLKLSALRKINIGEVFKEIYNSYPAEKVVGIYRMTTPSLLLRDLDVIKHVMIKDFDCFSDRGISFSEEGLGANLFHADSHMWYMLRNRFTPLFTSGKLKNMIYLMNERGDKFVDYISCLNQHEQEIHTLVQKYTIATISTCAFGLDIDTLNDKIETLKKIDKMVFTTTFANELDMMYPGIFKKFNSSLFPIEIKHFFDHLIKSVIAQRNFMPTNRKDFMDLILELRQHREFHSTKKSDEEKQKTIELTDDIIAAQAFAFYVAGYETSATTMTFMLYELAKNPDVQEKVIKELDEVLQRHNGEVTYETLNDMKYMEKVFDETLRMYPLVDPLQRRAQVDYTIPGTKVTVSKGQIVLLSPLGIHHDEKYYPDPEKFNPERFLPENVGNRHPCAYMPFGVGPRNCIDNGILNDTIIVFVSDNGGMTSGDSFNYASTWPLRGLKLSPLEGGVRVNGLLWTLNYCGNLTNTSHLWKGYIHVSDWLTTLLKAAGAEPPLNMDRYDVWENVVNNIESKRNEIFEIDDFTGFHSIIFGDYKLVTGSALLIIVHQGMRFAKVQSRMCITKLLSKFRIETSKKTPKVMEFSPNRPIIGPKGEIYLNIVPRK